MFYTISELEQELQVPQSIIKSWIRAGLSIERDRRNHIFINAVAKEQTLKDNLTSYFATLKSLWAHLTNNASEPISLCYTDTEKLAPHPIMSPLELDTLINHAADYFDPLIGCSTLTEAYDAIAFLLLTSHCRLRYAKVSENLRLGNVWLANRTLTVIITNGKGGKPRQETSSLLLPHWAAMVH